MEEPHSADPCVKKRKTLSWNNQQFFQPNESDETGRSLEEILRDISSKLFTSASDFEERQTTDSADEKEFRDQRDDTLRRQEIRTKVVEQNESWEAIASHDSTVGVAAIYVQKIFAAACADANLKVLPRKVIEGGAAILLIFLKQLGRAARLQAQIALRSRCNSYDMAKALLTVNRQLYIDVYRPTILQAYQQDHSDGDSRADRQSSVDPDAQESSRQDKPSLIATVQANIPLLRDFSRSRWQEGSNVPNEAINHWDYIGERDAPDPTERTPWIDDIWVRYRRHFDYVVEPDVSFVEPIKTGDSGSVAPAEPILSVGYGRTLTLPPLPDIPFLAPPLHHLAVASTTNQKKISTSSYANERRARAKPATTQFLPRRRDQELEDRLFVQLAVPEVVTPQDDAAIDDDLINADISIIERALFEPELTTARTYL